MDWPLLARSMGWRGARAGDASSLRDEVCEAMSASGPSLIEARIDSSRYGDILEAVRG